MLSTFRILNLQKYVQNITKSQGREKARVQDATEKGTVFGCL